MHSDFVIPFSVDGDRGGDLDIGVLEFSQFGFPVLGFEFEEHGSQNFRS
ncbi:MAG: hypothetical protein CM1200mP2_16660 [Planctomycetaceae bacterium]|nr:MAG: hypothetical protein CM1200mP2_16660 [Planctomycetaceae bacterium]